MTKPTLTPDYSNEIVLTVLVVTGMALSVIAWVRWAF
jgi:hypothetical protein